MIFHKSSISKENDLYNRLVSENNLVELGTYRVLFGYRVRAGFLGNYCVNLDWCAGSNWKDVERLYSIAFNILSQRNEDKYCFDCLPLYSKIKPFYNDLSFMKSLTKFINNDFKLFDLEKH